MKIANRYRTVLAACALLTATTAMADTPGADWIINQQAIQKLSEQGYADAYLKADGH
jgi:hypothetical protein